VPVRAGDTFLLTGGRVPSPHLWVVLWGPAGRASAYLATFLTTLRSHSDTTCVLTAGEHPFIRHETTVSYRNVQRFTDERLAQLVAEGTAKPRAPVDAAILERIRAGFFRSAHTPNAIVEMAVTEFGAVRPEDPAGPEP
jgi:hypothetical protein